MSRKENFTALKLPINGELIKEIVSRLVSKVNPQKIIMFGSHAYGRPTKESDLDLLIIKNTKLSLSKRYGMVSDALYPRFFPIDFIVRTPAEIKKRLSGFDPFIKEVLSQGKVLYEKK